MSNEPKVFTTPVGRIVGGSVSKIREKRDSKGQPVIDKKTGQPATDYSFGVAFPKVGPYGAIDPTTRQAQIVQTTHWNQMGEFGRVVFETGHAAHPAAAQRPDFSWKFTDGDSSVPNKKGNIPNQQEGYPGHWVAWFSSQRAPQTVDAKGTRPVEPDSIKAGHYIQVLGSVRGNTGDSPGVYLNHNAVAHSGYGPEISYGPDISAAGFGQSPLPQGASAVPVGAVAAPAPAPAVAAAPAYTPPAAVSAAAPAATVVQPAPSFLAPPANGAAPAPTPPAPAPAPAAAPAGPQMTAKANGTPYQAFITAGWTDANLRANGYMV